MVKHCCLPSKVSKAFNVSKASGKKSKLWNKPTITWSADDHKDVEHVRTGFATWAKYTGLKFEEVSIGEIRIGFNYNLGSWSYIGTDALTIKTADTMNFGWSVARDQATVLHEIGHMLGLSHEHQSPNRTLVFDEDVVYKFFGDLGWSKSEIEFNILSTSDDDLTTGYDLKSIMHYQLDHRWIAAPEPEASKGTTANSKLSRLDTDWAKQQYYSRFGGKVEDKREIRGGKQVLLVKTLADVESWDGKTSWRVEPEVTMDEEFMPIVTDKELERVEQLNMAMQEKWRKLNESV